MKRVTVVGLLAALAVTGVFTGTGAARTVRTITLLERNRTSTFKFVDNPPKTERLFQGFPAGSISPGDVLTVHIDLLNTRAKHVGWLNGSCTYTNNAKSFDTAISECHGVIAFRKGSLSLEGAFRGSQPPRLSITGGRGAYVGAEGTFDSRERHGKATIDHIRLSD